MLADVDADLYLTGEMAHVCNLSHSFLLLNLNVRQHDVLASIGDGRRVILCEIIFNYWTLHFILTMNVQGGHTNTERGYLKHLAPRLQAELSKEGSQDTAIIISEEDRHPLRLA